MSFDKAKAMRNAERYVSQGKIRSAIAEYRAVVENDPRDISTLNMLGDLYAKTSENRDAVNCFMQVAEHYSTQGFAQKAIAIYNKISRFQPDSVEVSAKLAELHKVKGSLSEAKSHYMTLAHHFQNTGKKLEALAMFKQIALLDPNNTEVCLNLAESYLKEGQADDAVESYAEAGIRFSRQGRHEEAILALAKGYELKPDDLRILNGLVKAEIVLGRAAKAISLLEELLESDPYNRDVLYLLIECCIDSKNPVGAENAVIRLVEIEPANYPKFLDLIRVYLDNDDPGSAARILTMCSEHLLAAGQGEECGTWITEILTRDAEQIEGLRLLVRYHAWLNDPKGTQAALERLYHAASAQGRIEYERFALTELVVVRPHENKFRERLSEIHEEFGYPEEEESLGFEVTVRSEEPTHKPEETDMISSRDASDPDEHEEIVGAEVVETTNYRELTPAEELALEKELESIDFYVENDYRDLAEKALTELVERFGDLQQVAEYRSMLSGKSGAPKAKALTPASQNGSALGLDELRQEFGIETAEEPADSSDYDTHFQMGIAYQEMGLMEEAIREFQDAIALARSSDGTRRFFHCSNLLAHCFLMNGKPDHSITWIERALATPDISPEEFHGLWYELASAYEAKADDENATRYFEKIYAENVDFRDVSNKIRHLVVNH
jgi:tetratricopeptide (TPR) repeat protein